MQAAKNYVDDSILHELKKHPTNFTKEEKDALHNLIHLSSNLKLSNVFLHCHLFYEWN